MWRKEYTIPFCKGYITLKCSNKEWSRLSILFPLIEHNGKDFYNLLIEREAVNFSQELHEEVLSLLNENNKIGFKYGSNTKKRTSNKSNRLPKDK